MMLALKDSIVGRLLILLQAMLPLGVFLLLYRQTQLLVVSMVVTCLMAAAGVISAMVQARLTVQRNPGTVMTAVTIVQCVSLVLLASTIQQISMLSSWQDIPVLESIIVSSLALIVGMSSPLSIPSTEKLLYGEHAESEPERKDTEPLPRPIVGSALSGQHLLAYGMLSSSVIAVLTTPLTVIVTIVVGTLLVVPLLISKHPRMRLGNPGNALAGQRYPRTLPELLLQISAFALLLPSIWSTGFELANTLYGGWWIGGFIVSAFMVAYLTGSRVGGTVLRGNRIGQMKRLITSTLVLSLILYAVVVLLWQRYWSFVLAMFVLSIVIGMLMGAARTLVKGTATIESVFPGRRESSFSDTDETAHTSNPRCVLYVVLGTVCVGASYIMAAVLTAHIHLAAVSVYWLSAMFLSGYALRPGKAQG